MDGKAEGLQKESWRVVWEHIAPAIVALAVLLASLATEWSKLDTILWTIVSYLLVQSLGFQVLASKEREKLQQTLEADRNDREDKVSEIIDLAAKHPEILRKEIIETLKVLLPATELQDKYLQIYRHQRDLAVFAEAVLERAGKDLSQILSRGTYTMRVVTPSDDYVQRWYRLMADLNLKEFQEAEFITMSNIVIWSSDYFGRTSYGNLQRKSKMKIKRIFVVPSYSQLGIPGLADRLNDVLRDYDEKVNGHAREVPEDPSPVQTKIYVCSSPDEYRAHFISDHERHSNNFAVWHISNDTKLLLTVDYLQGKGETDFEVASITFNQGALGPSALEITDKEESFHHRWESDLLDVKTYLDELTKRRGAAEQSAR